jgi:hypothetical protein
MSLRPRIATRGKQPRALLPPATLSRNRANHVLRGCFAPLAMTTAGGAPESGRFCTTRFTPYVRLLYDGELLIEPLIVLSILAKLPTVVLTRRTLMGEVTSLFYCANCNKRRFAVAIMTCGVCGRKGVRCPQYQFKVFARCESCASRGGKCARCGESRRPRTKRIGRKV